LRQCEDIHIIKQIIFCDYDGMNSDVEIQQTYSMKKRTWRAIYCSMTKSKQLNADFICNMSCCVYTDLSICDWGETNGDLAKNVILR
jgi:hypothetical protein